MEDLYGQANHVFRVKICTQIQFNLIIERKLYKGVRVWGGVGGRKNGGMGVYDFGFFRISSSLIHLVVINKISQNQS